MTRRSALGIMAAASSGSAMQKNTTPAIFELRYFQLRNSADGQGARTADLLREGYMPAIARAGGKLEGAFGNLVGSNGPFVLALSSFNGMAGFESAQAKLASDKAYQGALQSADAKGGVSFVRMESTLLRAFGSMPQVETPAVEQGKPPRVFELRTYESNSPLTLQRKIAMFEEGGEIAIFRRSGILPVFFAETIVGRNMPNLTYLVCYDSLAARDKAWQAFGADPDWQKLRAKPGLSDAEVVSNISNMFLRPLPFSAIR